MADSNQVIGATLRVDASSAVAASKSIADMKSNIKDLKAAFEGTKDGSAEQAEAFKKLTAAQDDLSKSTANLNKNAGESSGHFEKIKEGIGGLGGPLGEASEGVGKLNSKFISLLANPVVLVIAAIVGVLAFLYKAFTNTFEGGEKVEQVFAGIKAAAEVVLDRILDLGGAIIKFFSGDFKGAFEDAKKAVTGVGAEISATYNKVAGLTKQLQDLHKEQLSQDLDAAKRGADLAKLREQAFDPDIPIKQRKALLSQLAAAEEEAAKKDIDLAKRTSDAKIALLSVGKDAALKNRDEINQLNIDAINKETEASNEKRRIDKQIKAADKQEKTEEKAAETKAREDEKKNREQNQAFQQQLSKLQHENALAGITDQYAKEKVILENKLADEENTIKKDLENKKITRAQYQLLEAAQQESAKIQRDGLTEKHQKDVATKEEKFQKELAAIVGKTQKDGIADQRAAEKLQLEITHQEKIAQAIKDYKDDAPKLQAIKQALDAQLKADQDKLDAKNKKEDAQKKLKIQEEEQKAIINNKKNDFKDRQGAVDAEQALVKKAYDDKIITELDYNTKVDELSKARQTIRDEEKKHNDQVTTAIADAFSTLSDLAGKQTAAGKALAIASTTIKTFQSAVSAFEGMVSEIPGPVGIALGIVAAAGAVATGLAAVKNIVAVQIPGQGSGGTVPSAPAAMAAPVAPTQKSTTLNPNSINAIGNATSGRTYVLDADVQNNADRNARLNRAARLGG